MDKMQELRELVEFLKANEIAEFDMEQADLKVRIKFAGEPAAAPQSGLDLAQLGRLMASQAAVPVAAAAHPPAPAPAAVPIKAPLPPPATPPMRAPAAAPPPILVTLLLVWLFPFARKPLVETDRVLPFDS